MFFKIDVLKNLANFTGKHKGWSLFLRTPFLTEHLRWLLLNKSGISAWFIAWQKYVLVI